MLAFEINKIKQRTHFTPQFN